MPNPNDKDEVTSTEMPDGQVEFAFPDDEKVEAKVEVVDDTPEKDRGRTALTEEVGDPTEDELQSYSDNVQKRIKQITHARHDERRKREALEREHAEAIRIAKSLFDENNALKQRVNKGEEGYISQAQQLAENKLKQAQNTLKIAHETGDTDLIVESQTALTAAVQEIERTKRFKPSQLRTPQEPSTVDSQQPRQSAPTPSNKALEWHRANSWYGKDAEMTGYAQGLHNKLISSGVDGDSEEYYNTLNNQVRKLFPDRFSDSVAPSGERKSAAKPPATVVAPVSRATNAKKVVLTASQVQLAKRLGVPLEVYARSVVALESKNG